MGKYTEAWNKLKPKRPTRPVGAFARFVSDFNAFEKKSKTLFRDAADAWNVLTKMEKALYADQDGLAEYRRNAAQYKEQMSAMKGPPSTYALYVRYYWKVHELTSKGNTKEFGKIQQRIANDWAKLGETEKSLYKASADLLKALFLNEQAAVVGKKRPLNLDWQNDGVKNLEAALFKRQGGKQAKREADKEKDEQDKDQFEDSDEEVKKDDAEAMDTRTDTDDEDDEFEEKFDYGMLED